MTQPMSRDAMRELKAKTEEAARVEKEAAQEAARIQREAQRLVAINMFVKKVYFAAVEAAKSKTDTSYRYPLPQIPRYSGGMVTEPFYMTNMPEILAGLQELFPGCDVRAYEQPCIFIDWS
jgi:hypothetical protein